MSRFEKILKYLPTVIFALALLVWGGVGYLYLRQEESGISAPSLVRKLAPFLVSQPQLTPFLSPAVFTDESGLFSLKYDSQKYSIEKQTFHPLSALPTPWISNIPQEKSASITINRLVNKSGQEIFSFYLEDVSWEEKVIALNKPSPSFVLRSISSITASGVTGHKIQTNLDFAKMEESPITRAFTRSFWEYCFPVADGQKALVFLVKSGKIEEASLLIQTNLVVK